MKNITMADEKENHWNRHLIEIFILLCIAAIMINISFRNYLLFHTFTELFSIIIAGAAFIISINTYKMNKSQHLVLLGIAYGFIAFIDLIHTFTYKGIGVLQITGANIPTQLWIIGRYIEATSLLIVVANWKETINIRKFTYSYFILTFFLLASIFKLEIFPACFIEGVGLTNFKVISEYIICIILISSMILLRNNKDLWGKKGYNLMMGSIIFTILAELSFTLYVDVYGILNMAGHILKVISFYLVYKSVVETGIKMPYEELYQNEEKYRNLIELLPDAVLVINEGKIVLANYKFSQLLGFESRKDIIGKSLIDCTDQCWHPIIEKYSKKISKSIDAQEFSEEILSICEKDTTLEVRVAPFPYESYTATLIVLHDVSETKRAKELEKSIEENKKQLEESLEYDRRKTEFFSNLSHEMKTPLNLIFSTVQILDLKLKSDFIGSKDIVLNKYVPMLRQNCYRMVRLINNLLDITKMDAGYFKLELKNYNIVNVVEEITLSISQYVESKNISLIFDTDVEEKIVAIDPNAMERIMLNLLSNAIKFTDAGSDIFVNIYDKEESVLISVKDTGVGIPKDKLDGIFDRFNQVDKTLKRNQQGTGLGLSLVESLVKMHGGEVKVYSEFGEGTEFIIKLPIKEINYENYDIKDYGAGEWQSKHIERIGIEFSDIYSVSKVI